MLQSLYENQWLEDVFPIEISPFFKGTFVRFRGVYTPPRLGLQEGRWSYIPGAELLLTIGEGLQHWAVGKG